MRSSRKTRMPRPPEILRKGHAHKTSRPRGYRAEVEEGLAELDDATDGASNLIKPIVDNPTGGPDAT